MLNGFLPCSGTDAVTVLLLIFFCAPGWGRVSHHPQATWCPTQKRRHCH